MTNLPPPVPNVDNDAAGNNFVREIIESDLKAGRVKSIQTRFPPEPNGYLHLGHAKSICLNFGLARQYGGKVNLRMDDTNPAKEKMEYIDNIMKDVRWLGFEWDNYCHASDYFEKLYGFAVLLVKKGLAYVDHQTQEEVVKNRTKPPLPGIDSPFRNRSVEENLKLLDQMRKGVFKEGECTLRAKINMSDDNSVMRDPLMYRIKHVDHPRTGNKWCIYPMYDFAHGLSDAIEGVTHSICTTEFIPRRPLYDWFVEHVGGFDPVPHQYEMSRLNMDTVMMSKRYLLKLVQEGSVSGWDDPRMPTICGSRRRGIPPAAIRDFVERCGVTRSSNQIKLALWNYCVRDAMNAVAPRVMVVSDPLKVVLTNFDDDTEIPFEVDYFPTGTPDISPEDEVARLTREKYGKRTVALGKELWIEKSDFMEKPNSKFYRLSVGKEVRLRYGCVIKCQEVVKDPDTGKIIELRCTWDPESKGGKTADGRKVKGTIHWVSKKNSVPVELRHFEPLFTTDIPGSSGDIDSERNPNSLQVLHGFAEKSCGSSWSSDKNLRLQFERLGFYYQDRKEISNNETGNGLCCRSEKPDSNVLIFNRIVTLKDALAAADLSRKTKAKEARVRVLKAGEVSVDDFVAMDSNAQAQYMATLSKGALKKLLKKAKKKGYTGDGKPAAVANGAPKKQVQQQIVPDISKLDLRVGLVKKVWKHENADKLFCEEIDVGEEKPRLVASGLVGHIHEDDFVGKKVIVMCNLPVKETKGFGSHGMVMCASTHGLVELLEAPHDAKIGERVIVEGYLGEPAPGKWFGKKKSRLTGILNDCKTTMEKPHFATYKGLHFTTSAGAVFSHNLGGASIK